MASHDPDDTPPNGPPSKAHYPSDVLAAALLAHAMARWLVLRATLERLAQWLVERSTVRRGERRRAV